MADVHYETVSQNFYFNLKQYPHRYYLELVVGDREKIVDVIEMPLVQGIRAGAAHALESTETINGHYDESEGFRVRTFLIAGRSGYTDVHLERYHKFKNFIETYARLMAENKNAFIRGVDYRLVLNFPWEGESYYCNVIEKPYERQRGKQSLSLDWGLSLRTYGFATRKWALPRKIRDYLQEMCGPDDDQCHMGPRHPCRYAAFKAVYEESPPEIANEAKATLGPVFEKCDRVVDLDIKGRTELGGRGLNRVANLYGMCATAHESLYEWASVFTDTIRPFLVKTLGWLSNVMMECILIFASNGKRLPFQLLNYATQGVAGEIRAGAMEIWGMLEGIGAMAYGALWGSRNEDEGDAGDEPTFEASRVPTIDGVIGAADATIFDAADRLLGIRNAGQAIMALMRMRDSRTWENGSPIKPSDKFLMPSVGGLPAVEGSTLYGEDWLVQKGDFVMNDELDDFIRVEGVDCYIQNLNHRLLTIKTEIRLKPDVGLLDIGDLMDPNLNVGRLISDVKGQLLADHRTSAITSMKYTDGPGSGTVDAAVLGVANSTTVFSVTLPQG